MASIPRFDAAGNVYAVVAREDAEARSDAAWAAAACRDGAADGVLIEASAQDGVAAGVRIVNPDGSRAEMSGNGLRIFAHWLWREGRVAVEEPFEVDTGTRQVTCRVAPGGGSVRVALGPVRVEAPREIDVGEASWGLVRFTPVNVGNPHAVLVTEGPVDEGTVRRVGARVEVHPSFPGRTNVQFAWPDHHDPTVVHARVWERGAGWTASSGSSACAVTAAMQAKERPGGESARYVRTVRMPGGSLQCELVKGEAFLEGPVRPVG